MKAQELLSQARDAITVKRVFGEPYEKDGMMAIPVAAVKGGFGGGAGVDEAGSWGGGSGMAARPVGVFVIKNGEVAWKPALDLNRVIAGGQFVAVIGLLVLRAAIKACARRRR